MDYHVNTKMVAFVILLVCIAIGLFTYTLVSAPAGTSKEAALSDTTSAATTTSGRMITAKHQYRGGIHTIAGSVDMGTPCEKLVVEPFFTKPQEEVELRFVTTKSKDTCAQVVTPAPFKVTFEAPEVVRIRGAWDGTDVRLNLLPVGPDSSIDDEAHIKG
jgi:hypothetical protein